MKDLVLLWTGKKNNISHCNLCPDAACRWCVRLGCAVAGGRRERPCSSCGPQAGDAAGHPRQSGREPSADPEELPECASAFQLRDTMLSLKIPCVTGRLNPSAHVIALPVKVTLLGSLPGVASSWSAPVWPR